MREAVNRDGGRVARAATTAAGGVFAAKSIQGLDTENGERKDLMKQTAPGGGSGRCRRDEGRDRLDPKRR